ncbi:MAG TPA: hypothetical protein VF648_00410 [Pyrinomonadaceae bacterium]|jgi:hypothetical protein
MKETQDDQLKQLEEEFIRNQRLLEHTFRLNRSDLLAGLKPFCNIHCPEFPLDLVEIKKTYLMSGDKHVAKEMTIAYFDLIIIKNSGIWYRPEHHAPRIVMEFKGIYPPGYFELWKPKRLRK